MEIRISTFELEKTPQDIQDILVAEHFKINSASIDENTKLWLGGSYSEVMDALRRIKPFFEDT